MAAETPRQRIDREMREAEHAKQYAQQMIEHWTDNLRTAYRRYYQLKNERKALERQSHAG